MAETSSNLGVLFIDENIINVPILWEIELEHFRDNMGKLYVNLKFEQI